MAEEPTLTQTLSLTASLEALLFVAPGATTPAQLAEALDVSTRAIETGLEELESILALRGIRLQRHGGRVQLTTAPEAAPIVEHFLGLEATTRLTQAALEALAIVAFQQPTTRPQVDAIRGVNSDSVLKSLLSKGLVQEVGRAETPGRPILYATTPEFLQQFGLTSLEELPPIKLKSDGDADGEGDDIQEEESRPAEAQSRQDEDQDDSAG
jgi:segregation and condensation protein B